MTFHADLDKQLRFKTIDSTNLEAQRRRLEFSGRNVFLRSDEQTAGKGQHGRSWESNANLGLWSSIFLGRQDHLDHDLQLLSIYTGIIISRTIYDLSNIHALLKWPNDIMIDSKKCGGVLTEVQWSGSTVRSAIIGIGINLKHRKQDFPESIRSFATSLYLEGADNIAREAFSEHLIQLFFEQFNLLSDPKRLVHLWNNIAWKLDETVRWKFGENIIEGKFLGITTSGEAQIQVGDSIRKFHSGEISWQYSV